MTRIHEIDDPYVGLASVLPVQASGVLLQSALPGHRHGQHQRVERRVIEALANQLPRRKKDARRVGRQCIQVSNQRRSLLSGHSTVQNERRGLQSIKGCLDRIKVFSTFGQDQHLAPLPEGIAHLVGDSFSSGPVIGEMPKNVLDACIGRQVDPCEARTRQHFEIVRCTDWLRRRVSDRPALHEDDGLLTITADGRCRQSPHVFGLGPFQDRVE